MMMIRQAGMAMAMMYLCSACTSLSGLELAKNGKAAATIVHAEDAPVEIAAAAADLARVLGVMTGAEFTVMPAGKADQAPADAIVLGSLAEDLGVKMNQTSASGDGYRFAVRNGRLGIAGESPQGVVHGVYAFLEHLGCGWYVPGPLGEVIPRKAKVTLAADLDESAVSNAIYRRVWYGGGGGRGKPQGMENIWRIRNRARRETGSWRHAWGHLVPKKLFEEKPELFSFSTRHNARRPNQLCTTNPETIKVASETLLAMMDKQPERLVFEAGPNDGGGLCECSECAKLHTDGYIEPSSGKPCYTDVIFKFASDLADVTARKHPDKYLGILVYSEYSRPPVKITRMHPNVFPQVAPIRRSRLHGPGNPLSASAVMHGEEIRAWSKVSESLGFYVYNYNLADTLVPFTKFDFWKRITALVREADIQQLSWDCESMDSWTTHAPTLYLSSRMVWNCNLDIDAELEGFFNGFYGAAAAPIKSYWLRIDNAYANSPTSTGSQYGLRQIWTDELLAASRADISLAEAKAANAREREAVAMAAAGLLGAEQFVRIWDAIGRCDFLEAETASGELQAHITESGKAKLPNWYHDRYAWGYHRSFVGRVTSGGAQVLKDGGKILARLPFVWKFSEDPQAQGVAAGWFKPEFDDSKWREFEIFNKSWGDQGLEFYHGQAWYRLEFTLPETGKDDDVRLWFGGFDYNVDVYLNGQHLGERKGFARPGEFAGINEHLVKAGANVLALRVEAGDLAELGTGGLMMPVMIYRAAGAEPAKEIKAKDGVEYEM